MLLSQNLRTQDEFPLQINRWDKLVLFDLAPPQNIIM